MYRYCMACLVLASFGGCAVAPYESSPGAAAAGASPAIDEPVTSIAAGLASTDAAQASGTAPAPVSVEVKDFKGKTICEPIVATGTRMVIAKHCYTQDQNDKLAAERKANTRAKLEELRRSEEMGERQDRQREMDRQRAAMSSSFP
ncbi:MAG TPA: hypothetical protein VFX89_15500 [Gammaproteobacteria bacterium]|nr:hypothetical protein [Gammaproteobacteria bacterium]